MNEVVKRLPDYSPSQVSLIKRTVAKDCNHDEFDLFVEVCKRVGLDPFRRQIHALVFNKDKPDKRQMAIVTGIDGYRATAARNGDYRPDENPPEIIFNEELKDPATNPLGIEYAVVKVNKKDQDGWHPVAGIAHWEEFAPLKEEWAYDQEQGKRQPTGKFALDYGNWRKMPKVMIAKCAESQALRKGWPEDLSGVYTEEEIHQAIAHDFTASQQVAYAEEEHRLQLVNTGKAIPILWKAGDQIEFVPDGQIADRIMAFIREAEPIELDAWRRTNAQGLKQFWAHMPSDALEVKKAIEQRLQFVEKNDGEETVQEQGRAAPPSDPPPTTEPQARGGAPYIGKLPDGPYTIPIRRPTNEEGTDMQGAWMDWTKEYKAALTDAADVDTINAYEKGNESALNGLQAASESYYGHCVDFAHARRRALENPLGGG